MASAAQTNIKSGIEIVSEFVDSLEGDTSLDKDTLSSISALQKSGKLTRTRLLQALAAARTGKQATQSEDQSGE
jgi:hypothetical protein